MFWACLFSKNFEPCLFSNRRLLSREYGILSFERFCVFDLLWWLGKEKRYHLHHQINELCNLFYSTSYVRNLDWPFSKSLENYHSIKWSRTFNIIWLWKKNTFKLVYGFEVSNFWPRATLKGLKRSFVVVVLVLGVETWVKNVPNQTKIVQGKKNCASMAQYSIKLPWLPCMALSDRATLGPLAFYRRFLGENWFYRNA